MDGGLHANMGVRTASLLSVALAPWACGCTSNAGFLSPSTPGVAEPMCVCVPATRHVSVAMQPDEDYYDAYHSRRPRSIDLGYIGDAPIGLGPQPQHHLQEWEKPFRLGGAWSRGWR